MDTSMEAVAPETGSTRRAWWGILAVFVPSALFTWVSHDVAEYHRYALAFLAHPGTAWPREYPPLAIVPMLLAVVPLLFTFGMAEVGVLTYGVLRKVDPRAARTWILGCALGALFVATGRFDLLPSLLVVLALLAAERHAWVQAWTWTAAAAALQWFGAVLGPIWLIAEWRMTGRWRWDRAAAAGGAVLATYGLAAVGAGPHAALSSILWFLHRPVEIESLAATLGAALGPLQLVHSFGSWNVLGSQMPGVHLGFIAAQVVGQAGLWVAYARGRVGLRTAAALAVTWLVLAGSLFSAQNLLWMLPLWALADWRPRWLVLVVCLLTTVDYPFGFLVSHGAIGSLLAASARNVALLALVIAVGYRAAALSRAEYQTSNATL